MLSEIINKEYSSKNKINIEKLTEGSSRKVWWECSICHKEWSTAFRNRVKLNTGCPSCGLKKSIESKKRNKILEEGSFKSSHPIIALQWSSKNVDSPEDYHKNSKTVKWWNCRKCHGEWKASIYSVVNSKYFGCPYCSHRKILKDFNDLNTTHPVIASFWDYSKNTFTSDQVTAGSGRKFFWKCKNGHSSFSSVKSKVRSGIKCYQCSYVSSSLEEIVKDYISSVLDIDFISNNRLLKHEGKQLEIDILIPEYSLAIEVQDFYTHSRDADDVKTVFRGREIVKKGPSYHSLKRRLAREQLSVELVDLWQDSIEDGSFRKEIRERILTTW